MCFELSREVEWCLATELNDHTVAVGLCVNFEDVFEGKRFEEQLVGGVIVGRNGFWIRVDHDGFVAGFTQREGGMHTAVVKFNTLSDTIWATAQDHDLLFIALGNFVFRAVGRIVVGCECFKLSRTSVD